MQHRTGESVGSCRYLPSPLPSPGRCLLIARTHDGFRLLQRKGSSGPGRIYNSGTLQPLLGFGEVISLSP